MKRIVLDANFLMDTVKFKIRLESIESLVTKPYVLVTVSAVVDELLEISGRNKNAKVALRLVSKIKVVKTKEKNADRAIVALAKRSKNTIVATNDVELRKKLKKLGVQTIYLRARKKLAIR